MTSIVVIVSVDWEGRSLLEDNIAVMKEFRARHTDVPMQQFLNAAYYTKEEADNISTTRMISSTLLFEDDHALHLHAWNSLFEKAGITVIDEPGLIASNKAINFYKNPDDWGYYRNDWGHSVPIDQFSVNELSKVVEVSIDTLTSEGFRRPTSFRAGGWMAGENVLQALVKNNFMLDASAGNVKFVKQRFNGMPLVTKMSKLWPHINDCSQPYKMEIENDEIWQFPNNGCLADYTTSEDIIDVFERNVKLWRQSKNQPIFVSIGFHQETAVKYLERIDKAVTSIKAMAKKQNLPVVFSADPLSYLGAP